MPVFFETNKNFKNKKGDMISKKKVTQCKREKGSSKLMLLKINYSKLKQRNKVKMLILLCKIFY